MGRRRRQGSVRRDRRPSPTTMRPSPRPPTATTTSTRRRRSRSCRSSSCRRGRSRRRSRGRRGTSGVEKRDAPKSKRRRPRRRRRRSPRIPRRRAPTGTLQAGIEPDLRLVEDCAAGRAPRVDEPVARRGRVAPCDLADRDEAGEALYRGPARPGREQEGPSPRVRAALRDEGRVGAEPGELAERSARRRPCSRSSSRPGGRAPATSARASRAARRLRSPPAPERRRLHGTCRACPPTRGCAPRPKPANAAPA